jgi:hypothetical protein
MPAGKLRCCHAHANRCWRWASEATSDEHRQAFLDAAGVWRAMASREERRLQAVSLPVVRHSTSLKPSLPNQFRSSRSDSNHSVRHLFNGDAADTRLMQPVRASA